MSLPKYFLASILKISSLLILILLAASFLSPHTAAHSGPVTRDPLDPALNACVDDDPDLHFLSMDDAGSPVYSCLHRPSSSGSGFTGRITNLTDPLEGNISPTVGGIIGDLLPFIFGLAGMLSLLFLLWGGIKYMSARGDPKAIDEARGTLTSAVIGLVIILLAVTIFFLVGESGFEINIFGSIQLATPAYAQAPVDLENTFSLASIFPDAGTFFTRMVRLVLAIAAFLFFTMMIWGGIRYLNAGGNQDDSEAARSILTSAFIGVLIVVASFVIIELLENATGVPLDIF